MLATLTAIKCRVEGDSKQGWAGRRCLTSSETHFSPIVTSLLLPEFQDGKLAEWGGKWQAKDRSSHFPPYYHVLKPHHFTAV